MNQRRARQERAFARALGLLPDAVRRRLAGPSLQRYRGVTLDSRVALLARIAERRGLAFRPDLSVEALRTGYARTTLTLGVHERRPVGARDISVPTDDGTIGARLYRPAGVPADEPLPLLVYFHGGGWVIGDVASYDGLTRFFAAEGRLAVLSVDYRLGPEFAFPRGHRDAVEAFDWAVSNAAALGADTARIAVGGDSAGGGLSASVSAHNAARGKTMPAYQFLIYPSTDRAGDYPSRTAFTEGLPLTTQTIEWFGRYYRPAPGAQLDASVPLYGPMGTKFPERMPPTYVLAAGFDPLVDEGRAYAERLRAAGVPVTYDLRTTLPHGFVNTAGVVPEAGRALTVAIRTAAAALRGLR